MGSVTSPSDIRRGRRKVMEELARDLDPSHRDAVIGILETWKEGESEDKLRRLLGGKMTKKMLAKLDDAS